MSEERIPKRSEVPEQFKWALEDIYATDAKWAEDLQKLKAMPERIAAFKGRLSESADTLYDFMQLSDEISVLCDSLGNYAQRRSDEDTANAKYQGFIGQLMNAYVAVNSAGSFETPEIISIEEDKLQEFYEDKPELKLYKRALDKLRRKKAHILSEAEEKILALTGEMGQSPENIYSMFSDADLRFPDAVDKDGKKFKAQGGDRVMYTTHHPCWDAKNRDGLPSEMPFEYSGIAHLFAYTQPAEMPKPVPMPRRVQEQLAQPKAAPQPPHKTSNAVTLQQAQPTAAPKAEEPLTDLSGFEDVAPPIVIPEGIPKALADLMRANNVSESDIRLVVSQRNYFPYDTPITNYPDDFVQGCLIGAWEQMLPLIRENQKVPF